MLVSNWSGSVQFELPSGKNLYDTSTLAVISPSSLSIAEYPLSTYSVPTSIWYLLGSTTVSTGASSIVFVQLKFFPFAVAFNTTSPLVFVTVTLNEIVFSASMSTFQVIFPFSSTVPSSEILFSTNSVPSGTIADTFIPSSFWSLVIFMLYVISIPFIT